MHRPALHVTFEWKGHAEKLSQSCNFLALEIPGFSLFLGHPVVKSNAPIKLMNSSRHVVWVTSAWFDVIFWRNLFSQEHKKYAHGKKSCHEKNVLGCLLSASHGQTLTNTNSWKSSSSVIIWRSHVAPSVGDTHKLVRCLGMISERGFSVTPFISRAKKKEQSERTAFSLSFYENVMLFRGAFRNKTRNGLEFWTTEVWKDRSVGRVFLMQLKVKESEEC